MSPIVVRFATLPYDDSSTFATHLAQLSHACIPRRVSPVSAMNLPKHESNDPILAGLAENPSLAVLATSILDLGIKSQGIAEFLNSVLPEIANYYAADFVAIAKPREGTWILLGHSGEPHALPEVLMGESLDTGRLEAAGDWIATPLELGVGAGPLLTAHLAADRPADSAPEGFDAIACVLGRAMHSIYQSRANDARVQRLEAILKIARQWNRTEEMEPLLVQIAQSATRLLRADRASIFLWDRHAKVLVGRPALGVEGGELRVADDAGIVGQVVQTGEPRRVDQSTGSEQINRDVDNELGYRTETLLCVPLRDREGKLFGVFEMINKLEGNFIDEDEEALVELATHAAVALENTHQREHLIASRRQMTDEAAQNVQLVGQSPAIAALRSTVERVAKTDLAALILGENGCGKEVVARLLHYLSDRRDQPFVAVNCAAIAETLLESELFGHEKGAFTDAHDARPGKFELAHQGTLLLDEIGELSPGGQAKLLRVLEEKVVVRVGGSRPIHSDVRILAATNQDLTGMVRDKSFREDLFYRLNVVVLELPPLRDRSDDILLLAEHFLRHFCAQARREMPRFTAAASGRLRSHTWPGNVRELRNVMERLAYLTEGDVIESDDLAFILVAANEAAPLVSAELPLADATDRFQADYIRRVVAAAAGNMSAAAKRLGLHRSNLYRKMRQLGMEDVSGKGSS